MQHQHLHLRYSIHGQAARRKDQEDRTEEECYWISLDFALQPHLYEPGWTLPPTFLNISNKFDIPSDRLCHLVVLSKTLQHACGEIRTEGELHAYLLLHKYYDLDSNGSSSRRKPYDVQQELQQERIISSSKEQSIIISSLCQTLASREGICNIIDAEVWGDLAIPESVPHQSIKVKNVNNYVTYSSLDELVEGQDSRVLVPGYIILNKIHRFVSETSVSIDPGVRRIHPIVLYNDNIDSGTTTSTNNRSKLLSSLTVNIIFQGEFAANGSVYAPAHMSASLNRIHDGDIVTHRECIGTADHTLQVINTNTRLGRIVITEDPAEKAIEPARLEVVVTSYSKCHYSIVLSGRIMYAIEDYLMDQLHVYLIHTQKITLHRTSVVNRNLDVKLCKRKHIFLELACRHVEKERQECIRDIEDQEYAMENNDDLDYFDQSDYIKDLERNFSAACRRLKLLGVLMEETNDQIDSLQEERNQDISAIQSLASQNNKLREILCGAFHKVHGEKVANRLRTCMGKYSRTNSGIPEKKIENEPIYTKSAHEEWQSILEEKRAYMKEIERVETLKSEKLVESIVHSSLPQLFPRETLLMELQRHLDSLLMDQIRVEEGSHPLTRDSAKNITNEEDSFVYTFDSADMIADIETRTNGPGIRGVSDDGEGKECLACGVDRCVWKGTVEDCTKLTSRRGELSHTIIDKRKKRVKYAKKKKSKTPGDDEEAYNLDKAIHEMIMEADKIDDILKLHDVDKELHDTYTTGDRVRFVVIRSLHNFDNCMRSNEAIAALEGERDILLAHISAREVLDDILERMEDAWVFGRPPPEKSNAIPLKEINQEDAILEIGAHAHLHAAKINNEETRKFNIIELEKSERSTQIVALCWILRYFRAMNHLQEQKAITWERSDKFGSPKKAPISLERSKMIAEEENARMRDERMKVANDKAEKGRERKLKRKEYEQLMKVQKLHNKYEKVMLEHSSALRIQALYRGHLGWKAGRRWMLQMERVMAWHALSHASAICISRRWRGHKARRYVAERQKEIAKYILALRRAEAEEDEKEYWSTLKFGERRRRLYYHQQKYSGRSEAVCTRQKVEEEGSVETTRKDRE